MKRSFALIVLLALCFGICSCAPQTELKDFDELFPTESEEESESQLFSDKIYYVIIPQKSSGKFTEKARTLCNDIEQKTKISCVLKYDNEELLVSENSTEIILGATSRLESIETVGELKQGEYLCKWYNGCIVLGGKSEEATSASIDEFNEKILHGASSVSLMGENASFEKKIEFDVDKVLINGYNLFDFSIVYPHDNLKNEKEMAMVLRDYIANKSGYYLSVVDDKSNDENGRKFIHIGGNVSKEENSPPAFIENTEYGVAVYGENKYLLSLAVSQFANELFGHIVGKDANCDIGRLVVSQNVNSSVSIGYVSCEGNADLFLIKDLIQKIDYKKCDFISFGVVNKSLSNMICVNFPETYSYKSIDIDANSVFLIAYKENSISVKDCVRLDDTWKAEIVPNNSSEKFDVLYALGDVTSNQNVSLADVTLFSSGNELVGNNIIQNDRKVDRKTDYGWSIDFLTFDISREYHPNYLNLENAR